MYGEIARIQRYATKDGPGIRSTVFFTGCNLRCLWCANPEAMLSGVKVFYDAQLCRRCGLCAARATDGSIQVTAAGCRIDRARCKNLRDVAAICPYGAYEVQGESLTPDALCEKLLRDEPYYRRSGGGVTFSGGEPCLQSDFLREALPPLKRRGVHVALDTAGLWEYEAVRPLLSGVDLVLYDLKAFDPALHVALTGADNALILDNARRLAREGARLRLRLVLVPGLNDADEDVERRLNFAAQLGGAVEQVDILPYHRLGEGKYRLLGLKYPLPGVPECAEAQAKRALARARARGLKATVGG